MGAEEKKFDYYVDGKGYSFTGLIRLAQSAGYDDESGFYRTSAAANFLRRGGYHVSDKPCEFLHPDEPCNESCVHVKATGSSGEGR